MSASLCKIAQYAAQAICTICIIKFDMTEIDNMQTWTGAAQSSRGPHAALSEASCCGYTGMAMAACHCLTSLTICLQNG